MSTKITNNLKVHGESTTQKYTDAQYNTDTQRLNGAQPGTPISSKLMNTGLRNATLVTSAFIEALKTIVPNDNDLTTAITVGADTAHAALVTALTEALVKIKVQTAALADNVKSGAIVEETTTARESKQGFGISLGLNSKLQFKTTWLGTYKNNDVLYYSAAGTLKGFYIVKGLSAETDSQDAGTLTITSGQTPTTHAANLQRLTFETAISVDTGLSKTDAINSSSTTNQLATAKAIWDYAAKVTTMPAEPTDNQMPTAKLLKDYAQPLISAGTANDILIKSTTDGILSTLLKVTSLTNLRTHSDIPTAKSVYDHVNTVAQAKISAGSTNDILVKTATAGVLSTLSKVTSISSSSSNSDIPTAKSVYDFVLGDETLIAILSNGGTVLLSALTAYRSIRIELRRKSASPSTGTFCGDVKEFNAANVLTRVEIAGINYWNPTAATGYNNAVIDESITSSGSLIAYLNSNYSAAGYSVGYSVRGTSGLSPVNYYYAEVLKNAPTYMHGGIRLEQFNGSTLTFATFARTSNTVVTLACNTNYELLIYSKL